MAKNIQVSNSEYTSIMAEARRRGYDSVRDYLFDLHADKVADSRGPDGSLSIIDKRSAGEHSPFFSTDYGQIYHGDSASLMAEKIADESVDLIMTSPPFGLVRKKHYGNKDADKYVSWFRQFAVQFQRVLKPRGSLVIDIGGAWKKGYPTRSLYHYELLIMLCRQYGFHLAQEFYWWNPSKLPTPAEWVNIRRIRVKDAVNCVWWLSRTPYPKASNMRVLQPYSESMEKLLANGYRAKLRPSGHDISTKFSKDNRGAIPPNLIAIANTSSNSTYQRYCREKGIVEHPARFPDGLPAFFIRMLTDSGDLVVDPFAGSCVTGAVAEKMKRHWICCELEKDYLDGSLGRFLGEEKSLFEADLVGRKEPYRVYPPMLSIMSEDESPLAPNGGETRWRKAQNIDLADSQT